MLLGHQGPVWNVVFSPKGGQVATSGKDGTTRLWDLNGNQIAQYEGTGAIRDDWQYIAVRQQPTQLSENGVVKLWPIYTLNELDDLFVSACEHLSPYLANNPDRSDEDRALCGVPPLQQD